MTSLCRDAFQWHDGAAHSFAQLSRGGYGSAASLADAALACRGRELRSADPLNFAAQVRCVEPLMDRTRLRRVPAPSGWLPVRQPMR